VPAIPPKKAIGNKGAQFVEKRRKLLNEFMTIAASVPYIFSSEDMQMFVRGPPDYSKHKPTNPTLDLIFEAYQA
jgi:sorting nexin-1/2